MSLLEATLLIVLGVFLALLCYLVITYLEREPIRRERAEVLLPQKEEVEETVRRLDNGFNFILLLIGMISAAALQYATAWEDLKFTTFSLRLLFIPIIPLTLFWLVNYITNRNRLRVFIRIFVWFYGTFTLFNDILFFLVQSFLKQFVTSTLLILIIPTLLYVFAILLNLQIVRVYRYERREFWWITVIAYSLAISLTIITVVLSRLPSF